MINKKEPLLWMPYLMETLLIRVAGATYIIIPVIFPAY